MGEKDLFDYWSDTFKVHSLEWNREVASAILSEWQAKFSTQVAALVAKKRMDRKYEINAFSSSYLNETLATFSEVSFFKLSLGVVFMVSVLVLKSYFPSFCLSTPHLTAWKSTCAHWAKHKFIFKNLDKANQNFINFSKKIPLQPFLEQ